MESKGRNKKLGKQIRARMLGDEYQQYVLWDKICDMLMENEKITRVFYEYDEIKSFDDVVVEYKDLQDICSKNPYKREYYQVKFHMKNNDYITLEKLKQPGFINATTFSFLEKLKEAYFSKDNQYCECRFILYTPWKIKQEDDLEKLVLNDGYSLDLDALFDGKTKSKMATIRKELCAHMKVNEDELREILATCRIMHSQSELEKLISDINVKLDKLVYKRIDRTSSVQEYHAIVEQ